MHNQFDIGGCSAGRHDVPLPVITVGTHIKGLTEAISQLEALVDRIENVISNPKTAQVCNEKSESRSTLAGIVMGLSQRVQAANIKLDRVESVVSMQLDGLKLE